MPYQSNRINECLGPGDSADVARRKLEAEIGGSLKRAAKTQVAFPVLLLSLTDNNRSPINDVPNRTVLGFVMDLLSRPGESRESFLPLLGALFPKGIAVPVSCSRSSGLRVRGL